MKRDDLLQEIKRHNNFCTGCGGCRNVCPCDAIVMQENELGFLMPSINETQCISCLKCIQVCPIISGSQRTNSAHPECLAVQMDEALRKVSSSGGVFSCLADYILRQNGCVFGAVMGDNLKVFHYMAEDPKELAALRKSKYVQSDIGLTYREVERQVGNGRKVLFSGTPCQIAALNNYLPQNPDNLFTVDVLCHGVPSWKMLRDSIKETIIEDVKSVDFRPMDRGWKKSSENLAIKFFDGDNVIVPRSGSAYEEGFHSMLTLRDCCYDCKFAEFPRQGDLSLGDFWGIGDKQKDMNDDLGTSVVFINTEKGNTFLQEAFHAMAQQPTIKQAQADWLDFNRIHSRIQKHPGKAYFDYLYPKEGFTAAVRDAMQYKASIAIVGPWMNRNCGGALTYYALYETLVTLGNAPIMLSQPEGLEWSPDASACRFIKNPYPSYAIAPVQKDYSALRRFSENIETFIVGSDQLFTEVMFDLLDGYADLEWVSSSKKKIAYAASFAGDHFSGRDEQKRRLAYFLGQFDSFSVREKSGVSIAKQVLGLDATWVVDPVFLCPKAKWEAMADRGVERVPQVPGVFGYILDPDKKKELLMKTAAEQLNCGCIAATDPSNEPDTVKQMWQIKTLDSLANEEFLAQIRSCKFVLTDSFHGVCFSIIFGKPFGVILNKERGEARFDSLLQLLGLEWRVVSTWDDFLDTPQLFEPIAQEALQRLEEARAYSRNWLVSALNMPVNSDAGNTSYEMACTYTDRSIQMLEKRLKYTVDGLNGRIDWLISHVDNDYGVAIDKQWRQLEDHRSRLDGMLATEHELREKMEGLAEAGQSQWQQLEDCRSRLDGMVTSEHGLRKKMEELEATDQSQWRQLEDHHSRLDGMFAIEHDLRENMQKQIEADKKQWEQLEDHRSRLDGVDFRLEQLEKRGILGRLKKK